VGGERQHRFSAKAASKLFLPGIILKQLSLRTDAGALLPPVLP